MMSVCFIQSLLGYKAPILLARAHSDNVDLLRGEGVLQKGEGVIKPGAGWTDDMQCLAHNSFDLGDGMDKGRPCNNWVIIAIELSPLSLIVRLTQFEYS